MKHSEHKTRNRTQELGNSNCNFVIQTTVCSLIACRLRTHTSIWHRHCFAVYRLSSIRVIRLKGM